MTKSEVIHIDTAIPWTVACQAPLSMESSRQEYWSGCHFLLQGISPTQGSNPGLLHYRQILYLLSHQGSPLDSSLGEESTCNAGDPSSVLGQGRSTGEGIGYPLQHSWVSLVAQLVKNPPAMRET